MSKFYSREFQDRVVLLYSTGATIKQVCKQVEVCEKTCRKILRKNNVNIRSKTDYCQKREKPKNTPLYLQESVINRITSLYDEGLRRLDIQTESGYSEHVCRKILKSIGAKRRHKNDYIDRGEFREDFFENVDCEKKAYWLGFLGADGNVFKSRIKLSLNSIDEEHVKSFREDLKSTNKIGIEFKPSSNTYLSSFIVGSRKMAHDLLQHGITPRKSLTYDPVLPGEDLQRHFWRGMIDGDGGIRIDKNGNAYFYFTGTQMACEKLLSYIKNVIGVYTRAKIEKYDREQCYNLRIGGNIKVNRIVTHFYKNSNRYLERKMLIAEKIMSYERHVLYPNMTKDELLIMYDTFGKWAIVRDFLNIKDNELTNLKYRLKVYNKQKIRSN